MAGLRTTTVNNLLNNGENESRVQNGKAGLLGGGRSSRTRAAMAEIGNQQGSNRPGLRAKDVNAVAKPMRMLTKQKATASLKSLAAPKPLVDENAAGGVRLRRKRKTSADKDSTSSDSMEIDGVSALPQDQDVEMADDDCVAEQGFSTENLDKFNIDDIDSEDKEDPQLVVDYVNEIYEYMRQLEKTQSIKKDYLGGRIGVILPKMRSVLVEWLVEVHQQFSLLQETLYLAVAILDRYMQVNAEKVPRKQLQLVGVASMFIAAKYEEMYAPEIGDFVYITDNAYSQNQIRDMEIRIMTVLTFNLGRPLPLHFLRRNSKAGLVDATCHTMAKYVMELTLLEYNFVHVMPSEIAAASLAFAIKALDVDDKSMSELWTDTLEYFSQYSLDDLRETLKGISKLVLHTSKASEKSKLLAIRKKYASKKFGKISDFAELVGPAVEGMAKGFIQ